MLTKLRGLPEGTRAVGSIGETALKFPLTAGKWQLLHESHLAKRYVTEVVEDDVNFANKLRHESNGVFFSSAVKCPHANRGAALNKTTCEHYPD